MNNQPFPTGLLGIKQLPIHPFTQECNPGAPGLIHFFMQNEPNFIPNAPTKHANGADFTPNFCLHLLQKDAKIAKNARISQLLDPNILKSIYIKGIQNFLPRNYLLPSQNTRYKKMQNKPNSTNERRETSDESRKHFAQRVTSHDSCETNPISTHFGSQADSFTHILFYLIYPPKARTFLYFYKLFSTFHIPFVCFVYPILPKRPIFYY
jgi:hypothetical protein